MPPQHLSTSVHRCCLPDPKFSLAYMAGCHPNKLLCDVLASTQKQGGNHDSSLNNLYQKHPPTSRQRRSRRSGRTMNARAKMVADWSYSRPSFLSVWLLANRPPTVSAGSSPLLASPVAVSNYVLEVTLPEPRPRIGSSYEVYSGLRQQAVNLEYTTGHRFLLTRRCCVRR